MFIDESQRRFYDFARGRNEGAKTNFHACQMIFLRCALLIDVSNKKRKQKSTEESVLTKI